MENREEMQSRSRRHQKTVGVEQIHSLQKETSQIKNTSFLIDTLLKCLGDYCVDNRSVAKHGNLYECKGA
eukprot:768624-Hanusia_phi.AAC.4